MPNVQFNLIQELLKHNQNIPNFVKIYFQNKTDITEEEINEWFDITPEHDSITIKKPVETWPVFEMLMEQEKTRTVPIDHIHSFGSKNFIYNFIVSNLSDQLNYLSSLKLARTPIETLKIEILLNLTTYFNQFKLPNKRYGISPFDTITSSVLLDFVGILGENKLLPHFKCTEHINDTDVIILQSPLACCKQRLQDESYVKLASNSEYGRIWHIDDLDFFPCRVETKSGIANLLSIKWDTIGDCQNISYNLKSFLRLKEVEESLVNNYILVKDVYQESNITGVCQVKNIPDDITLITNFEQLTEKLKSVILSTYLNTHKELQILRSTFCCDDKQIDVTKWYVDKGIIKNVNDRELINIQNLLNNTNVNTDDVQQFQTWLNQNKEIPAFMMMNTLIDFVGESPIKSTLIQLKSQINEIKTTEKQQEAIQNLICVVINMHCSKTEQKQKSFKQLFDKMRHSYVIANVKKFIVPGKIKLLNSLYSKKPVTYFDITYFDSLPDNEIIEQSEKINEHDIPDLASDLLTYELHRRICRWKSVGLSTQEINDLSLDFNSLIEKIKKSDDNTKLEIIERFKEKLPLTIKPIETCYGTYIYPEEVIDQNDIFIPSTSGKKKILKPGLKTARVVDIEATKAAGGKKIYKTMFYRTPFYDKINDTKEFIKTITPNVVTIHTDRLVMSHK